MVTQFLSQLRSKGIEVRLKQGRLSVTAPKGVMTTDIASQIKHYRPDIVAFLSQAHIESSAIGEPLPIKVVDRHGVLPLSPGQERLLALAQYQPDVLRHIIPIALQLDGDLKRDILIHAIEQLVTRHEILRMTFQFSDSGVLPQIQDSPQPIELLDEDLSSFSKPDQDAQLQNVLHNLLSTPFDLQQGPLFHTLLVKLGPQQHVLALIFNHIIFDGWSAGIFIRELSELYSAALQNRRTELPFLKVQYVDYAAWYRQWLDSETAQSQLSYWQTQLSDVRGPLKLPYREGRRLSGSYDGEQQSLALSMEAKRQLESFSVRERVTVFMILLSAYGIVLNRYSDQDDLIVCSPIAGRPRTELESVVGYFNNILLLRQDLTADPTLREIVQRVRKMVLNAYSHQDIPFHVVAGLPSLAGIPLSRALFVLQDEKNAPQSLGGLSVSPVAVEQATADFDLALEVLDRPQEMVLRLWYKRDLFAARDMKLFLRQLETVIDVLMNSPDKRLSALPSHRQLLAHTSAKSDLADETASSASTVLQLQLVQIWEQLFAKDTISISDNFFDLGGDSMMAVRLIVEIEKITGIELPLASLFASATIKDLADRLEQSGYQSPWSPLVPLQKRGDLDPIFIIHGRDGSVDGFKSLAKSLGKDQPVFGLQALGLAPSQHPLSQIEQMASLYKTYICQVQPQGPYRIIGWQEGGAIAYEIGRCLEASGQTATVFAIDTPRPSALSTEGLREKRSRSNAGSLKNGMWQALGRISDKLSTQNRELTVSVQNAMRNALKLYKARAFYGSFVYIIVGGYSPWVATWRILSKGRFELVEILAKEEDALLRPSTAQRVGTAIRNILR